MQLSVSHILISAPQASCAALGQGSHLGSPCGSLKLSRRTLPSSRAPTPAPSVLPSLQSAISAGHLQMEFFWQEVLVALPDQLAPLLGSVAVSGAAEAVAWVGVDICLVTGCLPLPVPPTPCPCDPDELAELLIFLKCLVPQIWGWTLRTGHQCSQCSLHPIHRQ